MKQMPVHANTSRNQNLSFSFFSGQTARDPSPVRFSPFVFRAMESHYVPGTLQHQPLAVPPAAQVVAAIPQAPAPPPPAGPPPQAQVLPPPPPPPAPPPPPGLTPASGSATMQAAEVCTPQRLQEMEVYMMTHHQGLWYSTLNNHASTRPKSYGGPVVDSISACMSFSQNTTAPDGAGTLCSFDMPNSYASSDGRRLQAQGSGKDKKEASENACRQAVAKLLLMEPTEVVLRPAHWKISPDELLAGLPGADTVHQALPVHVPARTSASGQDAATLSQAETDVRVAEILRQCLLTHGGSFDPSNISHKALGPGPQDERMYSLLNKLLLPTQLRPFVDRHPEFSWQEKDPKGMLITWAPAASTSPPAPSFDSCNQPACAPSSASASIPALSEVDFASLD